MPSNFFSRILKSEALVNNSYFFKAAVLQKLLDIRFLYKHCNFSRRLPTRQDGVENCDKVYGTFEWLQFGMEIGGVRNF